MKPCPFCGNDDPDRFEFYEEQHGFTTHTDCVVFSARVYCNSCGCTGPWSGQEYEREKAHHKALDAWENRT